MEYKSLVHLQHVKTSLKIVLILHLLEPYFDRVAADGGQRALVLVLVSAVVCVFGVWMMVMMVMVSSCGFHRFRVWSLDWFGPRFGCSCSEIGSPGGDEETCLIASR